jgi:hypothetical protein
MVTESTHTPDTTFPTFDARSTLDTLYGYCVVVVVAFAGLSFVLTFGIAIMSAVILAFLSSSFYGFATVGTQDFLFGKIRVSLSFHRGVFTLV